MEFYQKGKTTKGKITNIHDIIPRPFLHKKFNIHDHANMKNPFINNVIMLKLVKTPIINIIIEITKYNIAGVQSSEILIIQYKFIFNPS